LNSDNYEALLKGLGISVLPLSKVKEDNPVFRIDSGYYDREALEAESTIKKQRWCQLSAVASRVESFGAYALTNLFTYVDDGIPFLRCLNIRNGFTDFSDVLYITPKTNKLLIKSEVKPGMVLLTMSGSVGNATVALPEWRYPINSNQDLAKITTKPDCNPYYLAAFLNSRFGQIQMRRLPVGSVQQHILLWMIERLIVPRFTPNYEKRVAKLAERAFDINLKSRQLLDKADEILLQCLELNNWNPPEPLTYSQRASVVFAARRCDAEFFSPRVGGLLQRLKKDNLSVRDVAPPRQEPFIPQREGSFRYIEIGGLTADGSATVQVLRMAEAPSRATAYVHTNDVISSTVRPIRRLTAMISPDQDGAVCSSGLVVMEPKRIAPEVLLTFLRLPPICELMNLYTSASMYPAISERDLLGLPIREVGSTAEKQIVKIVQESRARRLEAERLFDKSMRAIETAVERGEPKAMQRLDEES
jgi:hypothetical protein